MYTDTEWDTLPRVILTGDDEWNTNIIEHTNNNYFDAFANLNGQHMGRLFNQSGHYRHREIVNFSDITARDFDQLVLHKIY